jgi:hypothetical protein
MDCADFVEWKAKWAVGVAGALLVSLDPDPDDVGRYVRTRRERGSTRSRLGAPGLVGLASKFLVSTRARGTVTIAVTHGLCVSGSQRIICTKT